MTSTRLLLLSLLSLLASESASFGQDDVADIPSERRLVGDDERQAYFLIPPADEKEKPPSSGFGLLLVLPGGDGSEEFHPFVKRVRKKRRP